MTLFCFRSGHSGDEIVFCSDDTKVRESPLQHNIRIRRIAMSCTPDFDTLKTIAREFKTSERRVVGQTPTIALTPVVDGRAGAYEANTSETWSMVEKVYKLISENIFLPDGTPVKIVIAPEIVYGARTGAIAQEYYTKEGVGANIWISCSWAYSDELMSVCQGLGSSEWIQAAYGLN